MTSFPPLVTHAESLLGKSYAILGPGFTNAVLRATFFGHFCAGENGASIQPTVAKLNAAGIGSILDYAAENELEEAPSEDEAPPDAEVIVRDSAREGVVSARTYDYAGESECDANADMFLQAIKDAADASVGGGGVVAIKVTALGKPVLLERMSTLLLSIRDLWWDRFADVQDPEGITPDVFASSLEDMELSLTPDQAQELFVEFDSSNDDKLDYLEWTHAIRLSDLTTREGETPIELKSSFTKSGVLPVLDSRETQLMDNMVSRLETVAEAAAAARVRLMIDAEQTYLQPAIDHFTLELQRRYNTEFPAIFNTYQCYLKKTSRKVANDLERSRREDFWFAGKLVRGAYMVQERARALDMGYEDPILPNIQATHANYDACVESVLDAIDRANVMIASHNESSIVSTVQSMASRGIPKDGGVYFGQLLGMSDHITYTLGGAGYNAYKYVPYGPIDEVVPYLVRRAQENSGMLSNVSTEKAMLRSALWSRLVKMLDEEPKA